MSTLSASVVSTYWRSRWWVAVASVVAVTGAVVLAALALTLRQEPVYTSTATVVVRTEASAQLFPLGSAELDGRTMSAEADFLHSTTFFTEAEVAAGNADPVTVRVGGVDPTVPESVITFTASSPTAERAASTAQTWARTYIELRHDIDVADFESRRATIDATQSALSTLTAEQAGWGGLDGELASTTARQAQLDSISTYLSNPELSARVNTDAVIPGGPTSPDLTQNLILAALAGAALGLVGVALTAWFDDRLDTTDDIDEATGLPNLTVVPDVVEDQWPLDLPAGSEMEESFEQLVASLGGAATNPCPAPVGGGSRGRVLLITSPQPGEGKTSTAVRLAMALSDRDRNVLVIGGDLRRPTLSAAIGAPDGPGIGDYLTNHDVSLEHCLHQIDRRKHLVITPAGEILNDRTPAEVLRSEELADIIDRLRHLCDYIIIDGPALLPVVDSLELAALSDAVILSLYAHQSRRRDLQRALRLIDQGGPGLRRDGGPGGDGRSPAVLGYVLHGVG